MKRKEKKAALQHNKQERDLCARGQIWLLWRSSCSAEERRYRKQQFKVGKGEGFLQRAETTWGNWRPGRAGSVAGSCINRGRQLRPEKDQEYADGAGQGWKAKLVSPCGLMSQDPWGLLGWARTWGDTEAGQSHLTVFLVAYSSFCMDRVQGPRKEARRLWERRFSRWGLRTSSNSTTCELRKSRFLGPSPLTS